MTSLRAFTLVWGLLLIALTSIHAEGTFKYSYVPKKVYADQIFPVTIIDTRTQKSRPVYRFEASGDLHPLSSKPLIIRNGNDNFYTFYYKAPEGGEVTIPHIYIDTEGGNTILDAYTIPVIPLSPRDDFCGVLAADMKIRGSQVSHYDEKSYLVTLSVEAYEANLEDMHLTDVAESGVENLQRLGAKTTAEFYAVIPATQKQLQFTYFNTIKQQYISLEVPVELMDATVVTQSDLNPKDDSFEKLKRYSLMALTAFFLLMFLIYRDFFYLILGVVSFITLMTFYTPKKKVCIKQGAPLYILPTETSGIGTKVAQEYTTPLLGKRLEFNKVEYKHSMIGWVKDEDLCEN